MGHFGNPCVWIKFESDKGLCFEQRARTENAAREKLARKILTIIVRNQNKKLEECNLKSESIESENVLPQKSEPITESDPMDQSESGATMTVPGAEPVPSDDVPDAPTDETKAEVLSEIKSEPTKMEVDANG